MKSKSIHISSSKFFVYFTRINLLFLFYTITFIKHQHQLIYFTRYYNKIFILLYLFIISLPTLTYIPRAHSLSSEQITILSLSLSLSLFLFHLLSFFLKNQAPAIHEPSFTTGQSMNQAPQPVPLFTGRSTLHKHRSIFPIHKHRSISPIHKHQSVSNSDQAPIRQDPYP